MTAVALIVRGGQVQGGLLGVGIGSSDRTVGLSTTSARTKATLSSHKIALPANGESGPVCFVAVRKSEIQSDRQSGDVIKMYGRFEDPS